MNRLPLFFVTALLLQGAPALAQTQGQQPAPVVVPALPPSSAAPQPAPTQPDTSPPAPVTLLLTARPGTYAEYTQVTQAGFKVLDMHLEAQPGKSVKPADLAAASKRLGDQRADMQQALNRSAAPRSSKLFMKVLPPQGVNTVLLGTSVLSVPDPLRPGQQRAVSVRSTLTYDPAGKLLDLSISASDPQLDQVYKKLDIKTLIQSAQTSGTTALYGTPLIQGTPQTQDVTLPMQGFMQGLAGIMGSQIGGDVSAQASPLTMHVSTTYGGLNAQGQHTFSQTLSAEAWNVSLNLDGGQIAMKVPNMTGGGSRVVRQDGFLQSGTTQQNMTIQMTLDLPDEPYRMLLSVQYDTSIQ